MDKTCRTCYLSCPFEDCSKEEGMWKDYDLRKCTCERTMRTKDLDKKHYCKYWKEDKRAYPKFRIVPGVTIIGEVATGDVASEMLKTITEK